YRIIIDKNTKIESEINDDIQEKNEEIKKSSSNVNISKTLGDESISSLENSLYEKLPCGYVPKISPDGVRVLDVFSAKFQNSNVENSVLYLVILLNSDTTEEKLSELMSKFGKSKVTFVVPQYADDFQKLVDIIVKFGHEFFLQIPTQTSVPLKKQETVAPFLANMDSVLLIERLHNLLASIKRPIGIANVTPTLLTKSTKDMSVIIDELSKRGLAFLDLEKSNDVVQKLSVENSEFIYIKTDMVFQKKSEKNDLMSEKIIAVPVSNISEFMTEFSRKKGIILAPVSAALMKKQ
ncbi:MAG: divergent polysaccharide deacetylase family protein, partial [Alphaproteobacteria bacterium]|nr:divergent polysaccharide deacetylase family protein [Alphaproteobacteria bacterium]